MKHFISGALCALSLAAISFAAHAAKPEAAKPEAAKPTDPGPAAATPPAETAKPPEAAKPEGEHKWQHLADAHADLNKAKESIAKARDNHKADGGLGGHGTKADGHIDAAVKSIGEASAFADAHPAKKGKSPGKVTAKEKHHAAKDDAKYPNLGAARVALESAQFQLEEASQYHKPIGGLGSHAKKAAKEVKAAIKEIDRAEKYLDKHEKKK
jgi:hypothetical protein